MIMAHILLKNASKMHFRTKNSIFFDWICRKRPFYAWKYTHKNRNCYLGPHLYNKVHDHEHFNCTCAVFCFETLHWRIIKSMKIKSVHTQWSDQFNEFKMSMVDACKQNIHSYSRYAPIHSYTLSFDSSYDASLTTGFVWDFCFHPNTEANVFKRCDFLLSVRRPEIRIE